MESNTALLALAALAQPNRLAIFRLLVQAGPEGLGVGQIRDALDLPGATLSAHLNQLRAAGLVLDERAGRAIRCRAHYEQMDSLIAFLTDNCCAGAACSSAPSRAACPECP